MSLPVDYYVKPKDLLLKPSREKIELDAHQLATLEAYKDNLYALVKNKTLKGHYLLSPTKRTMVFAEASRVEDFLKAKNWLPA